MHNMHDGHITEPDSDRRAAARRSADRAVAPIWLKELTADGEYLYCATDLSECGVYFDHAIPRPVGAILCLELELPDDEPAIAVECRVVRAGQHGRPGMAAQFVRISADGYYRIRRYVRRAATNRGADRRAS